MNLEELFDTLDTMGLVWLISNIRPSEVEDKKVAELLESIQKATEELENYIYQQNKD